VNNTIYQFSVLPTAMANPTEPAPVTLQKAKYIYDGDGKQGKGVTNTTLPLRINDDNNGIPVGAWR
jgi:hypothetical protein